MRPHASFALVSLAAGAVAHAEAQRIVSVEILVTNAEDDATRARVLGQLSDLPVEVRAVAPGAVGGSTLRIAFETTGDGSRRVTVTNLSTREALVRRIELPNGPEAVSAQRESIALTTRRMVKALIESATASSRGSDVAGALAHAPSEPGGPLDGTPESQGSSEENPWSFGVRARAGIGFASEGPMRSLRGEVRGMTRRRQLRVDLGAAATHRAFEADDLRWSVAGFGPVATAGYEHRGAASRVTFAAGATVVFARRYAEGPAATSDAEYTFVLPRLEAGYAHALSPTTSLGVVVAVESEFPRRTYTLGSPGGDAVLASSAWVEPSLALELSWDRTEGP